MSKSANIVAQSPLYTFNIKVRPHYAAWQNETHCSFARSKSCIMRSHSQEKRIFGRPFSGYKNCGMGPVNLVRFFSLTGWYHFETPYSSYAAWLPLMGRQFADQIFRPRSIERHAAAKPTQHPHILAAWCDFWCVASPCCATWHSVDVNLALFTHLQSTVNIQFSVF